MTTRTKLLRIRTGLRDRHHAELAAIVDRIVALRHQCVRENIPNGLTQTRMRLSVSADEIESFLHDYLAGAVTRLARLENEVQDLIGIDDGAIDHLGHVIYSAAAHGGRRQYALDTCLSYVFDVAHASFGVRLNAGKIDERGSMVVDAHIEGRYAGQIVLDLWHDARKLSAGNHTFGIRNRMDWGHFVQPPVAYISCALRPGEDGDDRLTFSQIRTVFHELGHAVNHILVRHRLPYRSGLEYLPPERRECLSLWFEMWLHHPTFADRVTSSLAEAAGLADDRWQALSRQRRTYLERGTLALVDFDVHRNAQTSLRGSYERIDDRYGIARWYPFEELPTHFVSPRFLEHPGANFAYLWGEAHSCAAFSPLRDLSLDEVAGAASGIRERFQPSFDFSAGSAVPDVAAIFEFHDLAALPVVPASHG